MVRMKAPPGGSMAGADDTAEAVCWLLLCVLSELSMAAVAEVIAVVSDYGGVVDARAVDGSRTGPTADTHTHTLSLLCGAVDGRLAEDVRVSVTCEKRRHGAVQVFPHANI